MQNIYKEKDEALFAAVAEFQNGNVEKYNVVYESTYKYLYKILNDIVQNHHATEDLLQETYLRIYNKIDQLKDVRTFYVWAGTIATNMAYRHIQKNRHEVLAVADEEGSTDFVFECARDDKEAFIPEDIILNKEKTDSIARILDGLSVEQKLAVQYFYFEEKSVSEIAEAMNCSTGTIKSRLNYARKTIKDEVEKLGKKTGCKLYSISALPLFWLLFRQAAEEAPVTVATMSAELGSTMAGAQSAAPGTNVPSAGNTSTPTEVPGTGSAPAPSEIPGTGSAYTPSGTPGLTGAPAASAGTVLSGAKIAAIVGGILASLMVIGVAVYAGINANKGPTLPVAPPMEEDEMELPYDYDDNHDVAYNNNDYEGNPELDPYRPDPYMPDEDFFDVDISGLDYDQIREMYPELNLPDWEIPEVDPSDDLGQIEAECIWSGVLVACDKGNATVCSQSVDDYINGLVRAEYEDYFSTTFGAMDILTVDKEVESLVLKQSADTVFYLTTDDGKSYYFKIKEFYWGAEISGLFHNKEMYCVHGDYVN